MKKRAGESRGLPYVVTVADRAAQPHRRYAANLSAQSAVVIGLLVLAVVAMPWYVLAEPFETMAHEGAHALASWSLGGRVGWIEFSGDGSGVTSSAEPGIFSYGLVVMVGYLGPSAAGLLAALLISKGHSVAVLWLALLLLGLLLLQVRSLFSICVVIMAGAVVYLSIRYLAVIRETIMAYVISWFMLLSGARTGVGSHRYGPVDLTHLPRLLWARCGGWVTPLW